MPWLSILMAIISFVTAKKSGASNGTAAAIAGVAGLGTYYVSHNTDWGVENLGSLDGVTSVPSTTPTGGNTAVVTPSGTIVPAVTSAATGAGSLLSGAVTAYTPYLVGAAAGAAVSSSIPDWLKYGALALIAWSILK